MRRIEYVSRILLEVRHILGNDEFKIRLNDFDSRLILQKTIYLAQTIFGIDLGYSFGWYIYGPYSPDLTYEAFRYPEVFDSIFEEKIELEDISDIKTKIYGLAKFLRECISATEISLPLLLEFVTSVIYRAKTYGRTLNDAWEEVFRIKPKFEKYRNDLRPLLKIIARYV